MTDMTEMFEDVTTALTALVGEKLAGLTYEPDEGFDFTDLGLGIMPATVEHQSIVGIVEAPGWQVWVATYHPGDYWTPPEGDIMEIDAPVSSLTQAVAKVIGLYFAQQMENHLCALGEARDQALDLPF